MGHERHWLPPPSEQLTDRLHDGFAVRNPRQRDGLFVGEYLVEILEELPTSVLAVDLSVAELVAHRNELLLQQLHTQLRVRLAPVVAVREVERVDVPVRGLVFPFEDLERELVGRRDQRPAGLPGSEERIAVDLAGGGVVYD